jgi:hypothetical protein
MRYVKPEPIRFDEQRDLATTTEVAPNGGAMMGTALFHLLADQADEPRNILSRGWHLTIRLSDAGLRRCET